MEIDELTGIVIKLAIKIHSAIGPGCFERVYEELLYYELQKLGIKVEKQVLLPIRYESLYIKNAYKVDLLIENKLISELKTAEHILPVHFKQIKTHLMLLELKNGLMLNFKVNRMTEGIYRVFNNRGS